MNTNFLRLISIISVFCISGSVKAQQGYELYLHEVIIQGTSNLHNWTAKATDIRGFINENNNNPAFVNITCSAANIKSNKGKLMDSKIAETLNVIKYPDICYRATHISVLSKKKECTQLLVCGEMSIAGITRTITNKSSCNKINENIWMSTGELEISLSDYGIVPPTALWGTLTTGNEITITYNLTFKKKQ